MPTGDGLLVRVRVSAGRLPLDSAEALAAAARDCGNGTIEISSRANLQLRGVSAPSLEALQLRLATLKLIDADPETERVRNIVASPLSDIDPTAALDVGPVVKALEQRIAIDEDLRALPAKFGFLIDAGGRLPLGDIEADVRFEAFIAEGGARFAVQLAAGLGAPCATVAPDEVPDAAARLARAFAALAGGGGDAPRRMRTLVRRDGAAAIFAVAGLAAETLSIERRRSSPRDSVGLIGFGEQICVGAAPPFGRMDAHAFAALARAARRNGAAGFRLTPWRTIIAVGLNTLSAARLIEEFSAIDFIVARDDPRLSVVACPGAPSCAHAERDTRADASLLASSLAGPRNIILHVSGCAKGCARASATPLTLVAHADGYDLVVKGRAGDAPAHRALAIGEAAKLVRRLTEGFAA
jgi:precorrin-3B synthase